MPMPLSCNTRDSVSSSSSTSSSSSSYCNKHPPQGGTGTVSWGGSSASENGGVSAILIVEGDGSVGSVITSVVINIVGFLF